MTPEREQKLLAAIHSGDPAMLRSVMRPSDLTDLMEERDEARAEAKNARTKLVDAEKTVLGVLGAICEIALCRGDTIHTTACVEMRQRLAKVREAK
jgi:hypothetical protein